MRVRHTVTGQPYVGSARLVALFGLLMITGLSVAHAQPAETVTVTVPRSVQQTIIAGRSPSTGAPIEETTIARTVSYSDLDLAKTADANELKARVEAAAKDVCMELDKLYPFEDKDPTCAEKSAEKAMVQVDTAISEATQH
ncbi:MAG: UrcA family protein [Alphaproteobacteria bacterium]|nr:UrcA family protein [Alphaproteobacteria bacterium]